MKNKKLIILFLLFILIGLFVLNIMLGSVSVPISDILKVFVRSSKEVSDTNLSIIMKIRLPRAITALFLGGALGLSGFLLQTYFKNPIAGPFVLGISSGAKLFVAIAMIFFLGRGIALSSIVMVVFALIGAFFSMGFVLIFAKKVNRMSGLIVAGIMIGYICSAITDFLVTFASDADIVNLHNWSKGTFSGASWEDVKIIIIVISIAFIFTFLLAKPISAYLLGDVFAKSVGVDTKRLSVLIVVLSSILSACAVAFAGPISFVGVAVPHIVKKILSTEKPIYIIPTSFICGGIFCLFSDLLARCLFAPTELSISSVSAVIGAPIVIAVIIKRKFRYEE